jgi:hypothetical protein
MRGLKTGGIGFGIATALAVIALLILGGRVAIVLSSPGARAMPILSKVGPAEPFRATPVISQDSSPIPAAERKANARRPALRLQRRAGLVQGEPWADRMVKVQMPATACAVERKADRTKKPGGFRVSVARIATKIFSVGRKKKVDVALRAHGESASVLEVADTHRLAGFIVSAVGSPQMT